MPLFKIKRGKLQKLNSSIADKEKSLQNLVEENLDVTLGMHFLATEYSTTAGGIIDTLAIDFDGCPTIIEYKKGRNDNVINQSLSYLKWLKAQKKEFIEMLVLNKLGKEIAKNLEVNWNSPRVICIAENYSKFDIDTVEVVPIRIELFRYRYYEDNIFFLDPVSVDDRKPAQQSSKSKSQGSENEWSVERHLKNASPENQNLFKKIREAIMSLDENIIEKPVSQYIGYRVTRNFSEIKIRKSDLSISLRPQDYNDPKGIVEKVPDSFQWTMDRRFKIKSGDDVDYAISLIEQSYQNIL